MKLTHLRCPGCGSTNVRRVSWNEFQCEHCGSTSLLSEDQRFLILAGSRCQSCGFIDERGAQFCGKCGAKLLWTCPICDATIRVDLRYCQHCGTDLDRDTFLESHCSALASYGWRQIKEVSDLLASQADALQLPSKDRWLFAKVRVDVELRLDIWFQLETSSPKKQSVCLIGTNDSLFLIRMPFLFFGPKVILEFLYSDLKEISGRYGLCTLQSATTKKRADIYVGTEEGQLQLCELLKYLRDKPVV